MNFVLGFIDKKSQSINPRCTKFSFSVYSIKSNSFGANAVWNALSWTIFILLCDSGK